MTNPARLAVAAAPADDAALVTEATRLARELELPQVDVDAPPDPIDLLLLVTPVGLALDALRGPPELTGGKPFTLDLRHIDTTTGPGRSLRQPLLRAVGLRKGDPHRPFVLDATAGLGEDAWLLASMGCQVLAVERHPIVAALLREAVTRAGRERPEVPPRLRIVTADSGALLEQLAAHETSEHAAPEVVYLDPMFPPGRKTMERKPMRLLRRLVGADEDAARLLPLARRAAQRRVVVKRAPRAAPLSETPPVARHRGRGVRYDVYPAEARAGDATPP
ncbi:MAG: class I SAM-dependent methyltransferase [Phycisphaeraceae bacterium]